MSRQRNESIVGTGSWHSNQSYGDYRGRMTVREYQIHIYNQCKLRVSRLNLKIGERIRLVYIGGNKPRNYYGELVSVDSSISIRQKSRVLSFDITLIDDIEIINGFVKKEIKIENSKTVPLFLVRTEKQIKEDIDRSLDMGDKKRFNELIVELKRNDEVQ